MLLRSWPRNRAGSSSMRSGLPQNGDQQLDTPSSLVGLPLQMLTTPQASGCVARRWSALATSSTLMKSRETARSPVCSTPPCGGSAGYQAKRAGI